MEQSVGWNDYSHSFIHYLPLFHDFCEAVCLVFEGGSNITQGALPDFLLCMGLGDVFFAQFFMEYKVRGEVWTRCKDHCLRTLSEC